MHRKNTWLLFSKELSFIAAFDAVMKFLRFQVRYIKTRNQASVHKNNVVGELSIVVILKLHEGMHFSRSKNARLLNCQSSFELSFPNSLVSALGGELHDQTQVAGQLVGGAEGLEDGVVLQPTLAGKQGRLSSVAGPVKVW